MKYILVTGGVISGVGKGIVSSCIGTVLRSRGWRVTCIKIDPYLNIDAGTFSPYEHGEVYVLDDGSEVDLDLGNYERFLDINLKCHHNITTGRVYKSIIEKERRGDFLGKTVQVVPHVTQAIQEWVSKVATLPVDGSDLEPEICIIELGGTIGEIESMPFVESFRQMLIKFGQENFCCIHVSLIPTVGSVGEPKTKPTQMSVWELRNKGLVADILICRSSHPLPDSCIEKLSQMCLVDKKFVLSLPDVSNIYLIPGIMENRKITDYILQHLKLPLNRQEFDINSPFPCILDKWNDMIEKANKAINGTALQHSSADAQCSLELELIDSAEFEGYDNFGEAESGKVAPDPEKERKAWQKILLTDGVIIPGGFGERGIAGKLNVIRFCRENRIPLLGICLGYQCMTIEFARNVLKLPDCNSTEFDKLCKSPVVIEMPEHNTGNMGGTMRLGSHASKMALSQVAMNYLNSSSCGAAGDSSVISQSTIMSILNSDKFYARHRHRYEVNPDFIDAFEGKGLLFVGRDIESGRRMEIAELAYRPNQQEEWGVPYVPELLKGTKEYADFCVAQNKKDSFYVGVQFHPEYTSRPTRPSPFFLGLVYSSIGKLKEFIATVKENNILYDGLL